MYTYFGAFDVSYAPSHCVCTNRIVPLNHSEATRKFEPWLCNKAHNESWEGHDCSGILLLYALLQQMEDVSTYINLLVSKEIIQEDGADNVVRLVIGYKLWIITWARVLISGLNGMVFMEDFLGEPPRVSTISSIESKRSSYWTVIVYEVGRISKNTCMLSLVITNSLCLT